MTNLLFSFGKSVLLVSVTTMANSIGVAHNPTRTAFEILEVGRWSNPPKKANPLAAHRTYRSAVMNCDVGYSIYLPPDYAATTSARYPVAYWLPGGGCNEEASSPTIAKGLLSGIDVAIKSGKAGGTEFDWQHNEPSTSLGLPGLGRFLRPPGGSCWLGVDIRLAALSLPSATNRNAGRVAPAGCALSERSGRWTPRRWG